MPLSYNPKDVFIVQRNDSASAFVETILRSTANSVVMFDSQSVLVTLPTKSFADAMVSRSLSDFTASNSVASNVANTASFVAGDNVVGTVASSTSASFSISASFANTFPKELFTASLYQVTSSNSVTASLAINSDTNLVTTTTANSTFFPVISVAATGFQSNYVDANMTYNPATGSLFVPYISSSNVTASRAVRIGPLSHQARLHVSPAGTANINLLELDSLTQDKVLMVDATGSLSATGSLQGSASYAVTASTLNTVVVSIVSGSDITQGGVLNQVSTPMSFSVNAGEMWVCDAYMTVTSTNNRGMRLEVSSSAGQIGGIIEGWVFGGGAGLTSVASSRITTYNATATAAIGTSANTPVAGQMHFAIINPATASTISIAYGVSNIADTATIADGAYMVARKIR